MKIRKSKNVMERIKTINDVLEDHDLTQDQVDEQFKGVPEHLKYQHIAEMLCESLNEGWEPDWGNHDEWKYFPWFKMKSSSGFRFYAYDCWHTNSAVGSRLCFKTKELAKHAGKYFTDTYEKFMIKSNNDEDTKN